MPRLFRCALLGLLLLPACGSGFKLPGEAIFREAITVKVEEPVLPELDQPLESFRYPTFENTDGSYSRMLWFAKGEAQVVLNALKGHPDMAAVQAVVMPGVRQDANASGTWAKQAGLDGLMLSGPIEAIDQATRLVGWFLTSVPLVAIEARIVEVLESDNFGFGFEWLALEREQPEPPDPTRSTATVFNRGAGGKGIPPLPGFVSTGSFIPDLLLELGTIESNLRVDLVISALRSFTKVDVVNAPTVVVHAGHKAQISAGTKVPFFQLNLNGNNTTITTQFQDVSVDLQVLPILLDKDTIRMVVTSEVKTVSDSVTVSTGTAEVTNPIIATRRVNTSVDVANGSTVVLGGLITNQKQEVEDKIPFLGDVPIVKYFFSSRNRLESRSNLLFFITPKVRQQRRSQVPDIILPPEPGELESSPEEGSGR